MLKATDLVLQSALKDTKDLVKFMIDAIAVTLQGHHDLNIACHRVMKNDLNKHYTALCSSSPVDQTYEYLFGDLSKLAKDITDANQLTKKKCASQLHRLVIAGKEVIVLAAEKSTPQQQPVCSLLGDKRFFIQRLASSGSEKRGDHKQTINNEVSSNDVVEFLPDLTTFHAGNLRAFLPSWRRITSDKNMLDYVSGVKIFFEVGLVPCQAHYRPSGFDAQEELIVH